MGAPRIKTIAGSQHVGRDVKLVAIIDDDESMQDSLRDLIESAGLVARCFGSAEEFLESDLHRSAACVITDILMPKISGLELQVRLKEEECIVPIIFVTANDDVEMRIQAMREGAAEFLTKPFNHQVLLKTLQAALDMYNQGSKHHGALQGVGCGRSCKSYKPWNGSGRTPIRVDHRQ